MIRRLWRAFCRFWIDPQYQREIGEPLTISRVPAQWSSKYLRVDPNEVIDRIAREHVEHRPSRFSYVEHHPSRFSH